MKLVYRHFFSAMVPAVLFFCGLAYSVTRWVKHDPADALTMTIIIFVAGIAAMGFDLLQIYLHERRAGKIE